MPAYAQEVFGPVAPVHPVLHRGGSGPRWPPTAAYGLSLGILTRDVMKGLALAEQIPTGIVHINDQTVNDEAVAPFGGVLDSGHRGPVRRYGQPGRVHRPALDHRSAATSRPTRSRTFRRFTV